MDKERIAGLKTEISRIKDFILMNKKNIDAKKVTLKKSMNALKLKLQEPTDRKKPVSVKKRKEKLST